jgi:hypothetical protein
MGRGVGVAAEVQRVVPQGTAAQGSGKGFTKESMYKVDAWHHDD